MKSKKSRFWTFWLSFIPGCAEMYMGFMKAGLSLMITFWGIVALATVLNIGPLMFLAVIAWFYSFFHARNLVHLDNEAFMSLPDEYLFDIDSLKVSTKHLVGSYRKVTALVLIVLGACLCVRTLFGMIDGFLPEVIREFFWSLSYSLPQLVVGAGIIAIGFLLIRGKKMELLGDDHSAATGSDSSKAASPESFEAADNITAPVIDAQAKEVAENGNTNEQ